jgi:hypothetical protein
MSIHCSFLNLYKIDIKTKSMTKIWPEIIIAYKLYDKKTLKISWDVPFKKTYIQMN